MFQFSSVNIRSCTSISWYFNKIDQIAFLKLEKILQQFRSQVFCKMTVEVSRNNCIKRHKDWKPISDQFSYPVQEFMLKMIPWKTARPV